MDSTSDVNEPNLPMSADLVLENAKNVLASFMSNATASSISLGLLPQYPKDAFVSKPWGDATLAIRLESTEDPVVSDLNQLILPSRLSAIYHKDERRLEVIWTAFKLSEKHAELRSRKFKVSFKGSDHSCGFGPSSERLMRIANRSHMISNPVSTNFRNLASFIHYSRQNDVPDFAIRVGSPISFYVDNLDWDEDGVIDLIHHINFYTRYFDESTPLVAVHSASEIKGSSVRYPRGSFPEHIAAHPLNEIMLTFWNATIGSGQNEATLFGVYFRVVEYVSIHTVEEAIREKIRAIARRPDFYGKMDECIESMAQVIIGIPVSSNDEHRRFVATLVRHTNQDAVWERIIEYKSQLTKPCKFHGDFEMKPLLSKSMTKDEFFETNFATFAQMLKDLRNVLSHGRDRGANGSVSITSENLAKLRPWTEIMGLIASEALVNTGG